MKFFDYKATIVTWTAGPRSIFAIGWGGGGGLNKIAKAFLARAAGASVLGMLPRKKFKINASRMAKNTYQYSRHIELFYYLSG